MTILFYDESATKEDYACAKKYVVKQIRNIFKYQE